MASSAEPRLPSLIVVTDWSLGAAELLARIGAVLAVSPEIAVQLRHPEAPVRTLLAEARSLAALCGRLGNALFVNGRLDVALAVGAHLHLPAAGLRAQDVRPGLPASRWVSCAVHDEAEAEAARGADLALVSPVFRPISKPEDPRPPLGPEGFARLAAALPCPAVALGGVTPRSARGLPKGTRLASIDGVLRAADPAGAAEELLSLALA